MKPHVILLFAVLISGHMFSQSVYLQAIFAKNIPINNDYIFLLSEQVKPVDDSIAIFEYHESEPYSLGGGRTFGASVGYNINKNLTFDLAVSFSKSSTREFETKSDYTFPVAGYNIKLYQNYGFNAKYYSITPSVRLSLPIGFSNVYAAFGVHFSNIEMELNYDMALYNNIPGYYPNEHMKTTEVFDSETALGFKSGAGFELYLADNVYLNFEISYNYLKYVPLSSHYSKYEYMETDQLEELTINEKEFEYVDSYDDLENDDPDLPQKSLKHNYPFDHVAIQIGLKYSIVEF